MWSYGSKVGKLDFKGHAKIHFYFSQIKIFEFSEEVLQKPRPSFIGAYSKPHLGERALLTQNVRIIGQLQDQKNLICMAIIFIEYFFDIFMVRIRKIDPLKFELWIVLIQPLFF